MVVRKRLKRLEMAVVLLLISLEFFAQEGTFFGYDVQFPLDKPKRYAALSRMPRLSLHLARFLSHSHNTNVSYPKYPILFRQNTSNLTQVNAQQSHALPV